MKLRRSLLQLMLCVLILPLLSSCWSSKQIEDLSVYVGLGLDVGAETTTEKKMQKQMERYEARPTITATVQIVPRTTRQNKTESGSSGSKVYLNERLTGDSLLQVFREFSLSRARPLIGHHLKTMVLSTEISKQHSLEKLLDFVVRDNDIRPSCLIYISQKTAYEVLEASSPGEVPAFILSRMVNNRYRTNKILPPMTLSKVQAVLQSGRSFLLQNITTANHEYQFNGAAIIDGGTKKMIGKLNEMDLMGLSWFQDPGAGGVVKVYDPEDGHTAIFEVKEVDSRVEAKGDASNLSFLIKIKTNGQLAEDWGATVSNDVSYVEKMEQLFQQEIKENVEQSIKKLQKKYKRDVAGFAQQLHIQKPAVWKQVKEGWDDFFSIVPIKVEVEVEVTDTGSTAD